MEAFASGFEVPTFIKMMMKSINTPCHPKKNDIENG
jgi:hypothetical protein